ncbi:MAG: hypothetical protein V7L29_13595 [Nostoc sp.]|uniref:hypothetical protein n=1 Tax=Nostoc sp. TaxID=1180 RepID=UPI002FF438F6
MKPKTVYYSRGALDFLGKVYSALIHYFDALSDSYGREMSLEIIEECTYILYNKYPDTYEIAIQ